MQAGFPPNSGKRPLPAVPTRPLGFRINSDSEEPFLDGGVKNVAFGFKLMESIRSFEGSNGRAGEVS